MNLPVSEDIALALVAPPLSQEDQARADFYALIARLLLASPDATLLSDLSQAGALITEDIGNPLADAWSRLIMAAGVTEADAVQEEFEELFISTGTPRINPYASLYLTGFLNEKPLARLRSELYQLGLTRAPGSAELEDHLGALCEAMRTMITGAHGARRQPITRQETFFRTHIAPWYERCLEDIRVASDGRFYALVADLAQAFLGIEAQAFEIGDTAHAEWE